MPTIPLQVACLALAQLAAEPQVGPSPAGVQPQARPIAGRTVAPPAALTPNTVSPAAVRPAGGALSSRSSFNVESSSAAADPAASRTSSSTSLAQQLVDNALSNDADDDVTGQPTSLLDVLRQNLGQPRRAQAVKSYWQLASAIGQFRFAADEEQFLAHAGQPRSAVEQALLEAAIATASARRQETKVAVLNRQHGLAEEALLPVLAELPWPSDGPLVGAYRTKFQNLFARQPQPIRLQQIDRALPHLLNRIDARAEAVSALERAVEAVLEAYQRGQASLSMLLDSHDKLSHQRREFWAAVVEYNSQIADYAVTVAGPSTPAEILVSTLIPTAPPSALIPVPASAEDTIRRTSAEEPIRSGAIQLEPAESGAVESAFREVKPEAKAAAADPAKPLEPRPFEPGAAKSVLKDIRIAR